MIKGQLGYMAATKKKNILYGHAGLIAMMLLYMTGLMFVGNNGSGWTLLAVLIALPSAQFLARYLSLRRFGRVSDELVQILSKLEPNTCLYELALVIGKKTYYIEAAVLEEKALCVYTENKDLKAKDLKDFFLQKGLLVQVNIYSKAEALAEALTYNQIQSSQLLEYLRKALVENSL